MIRYSRLPANINELLPRAVDYLRSVPDIAFVYLFGTLAKRKPLPLSDIDIAIYCREDTDFIENKLEILGKLIEILQTDEIDLVILNRASLPLRMKILENKKVIVDNDPFLRHSYESLTMREYFDFSKKEMAILERRYLHG
jgi:predicted nucleotidyltransferase